MTTTQKHVSPLRQRDRFEISPGHLHVQAGFGGRLATEARHFSDKDATIQKKL